MKVYLESSAALRDLLDGPNADAIRTALREAEVVATSRLTLVEVHRIFAKLRVLEPEVAARTAPREAAFDADSDLWVIHPLDDDVLLRAGRPFPDEPVRTLDGVHLATLEKLSTALGRLTVVSTDERIRKNAVTLGFDVLPA